MALQESVDQFSCLLRTALDEVFAECLAKGDEKLQPRRPSPGSSSASISVSALSAATPSARNANEGTVVANDLNTQNSIAQAAKQERGRHALHRV
jgi:hypothetical protein